MSENTFDWFMKNMSKDCRKKLLNYMADKAVAALKINNTEEFETLKKGCQLVAKYI